MVVSKKTLEAITIIVVEGDATDSDKILNVSNSLDDGFKNIILDITSAIIENEILFELFESVQSSRDLDEKSFVICGVKNDLLSALDERFGEDFFNIVPTRNEAVDMVYMEEQERSLFN